jgi:ketosteroid isomerase-like protein
LLIGIISVEESLAARILTARGLSPEPILDRIEKTPHAEHHGENKSSALLALVDFLDGLKTRSLQELMYFFAENAQFIDASGKQWNRDELASGFDALFAPYGKKNATYVVEATLSETHDLFVAVVRWNNALLTSEQRAWMHRMTLGLMIEGDDWKILSVQVTPVDTSAVREGS